MVRWRGMNKNTNQPGSVRSCDLIDAKLEEHQLCGSKPCPCCGHKLEGKPDWVGLPAGVKFDPTDQELIEHLEAKVEGEAGKSHPLIDEFIPTIEGDDGICYTHPEKLPGVTRDGLSRHFFHRPSKAYTTGTRKRRKIQVECDQMQASGGGGETRWHKTGKTRPVMANGKQKGCKKILVLYTNFGKNRKPEKTNWVMHQYHLGQHEEEKEGELVVSKIFYQTQPRQCSWSDKSGGSTGNVEVNVKENRGSGGTGSSCSSAASREIMIQRDEYTVNISAPRLQRIPSYGEMDQLGYLPLRKPFDEAINVQMQVQGNGNIGEASNAREVGTCEEEEERDIMGQHHVRHELIQHQHHHHHHLEQQLAAAAAAYQIGSSRPPHSIATIISSPLPLMPHQQQQQQQLHHQTSIHNNNSNNMVHPNTTHHHFLQQQEEEEGQQHHHHHNPNKIGGGRSASGLEELIMMGCSSSSTTTHIIKQQQDSAGMGNTQEAEWLKYSSFWGDHDS